MSTSMPPPPTTTPTDTPVSGAGSGSRGDQWKQFLVNLTGGGMPGVRQQLEDAHAKRVAEAERNHRSYAEISQVLAGDKTGKYMDPQGNLTPEGQKLELQRRAAFDAWQKAAGVTKESKSIIGKLGQLTDKLVHHRAGGQPGQPSPQPSGQGMPAPPTPQAAAGPGGGGTAQTSGMPLPPGYTPAGQDPDALYQQSQAAQEEAGKLDFEKKKSQAEADIKGDEPKRMYDSLVKVPGITPEEARKIVSEKYSGTAGRPKPVMYSDPDDPTRKLFGTEVGGVVYDQEGQVVPDAGQVVPSMLPTARAGEQAVFNPQTNQFEMQPTYSRSQKVAPGKGGGTSKIPAPPSGGGGGKPSASMPTVGSGGRHGIPARQFNILQKQATAIDEARNSLIGDDPSTPGGLAADLDVFKSPTSVRRLSEYLALVNSQMENEAKPITGQGAWAAAEWYLGLPQAVIGLQQGALREASQGLDGGAEDGPEHRFVADYYRTMGTIGGMRASTGASAAKWSFNTLRSELPTPGPVTSYAEAKRRIDNYVKETNVVAKRNPLSSKAIPPPPSSDSDVIYAKDPQGVTHKAKKGTPLPPGWKLTNAPTGQ